MCIVLCRNKEFSSDSEKFSCTLWYNVGSLQTDNLQTFIWNNFPAYEDLILYQMSNVFATIKMCYVYNQWYDISCATLYLNITNVSPYILAGFKEHGVSSLMMVL